MDNGEAGQCGWWPKTFKTKLSSRNYQAQVHSDQMVRTVDRLEAGPVAQRLKVLK
jgi:hypothetical protein